MDQLEDGPPPRSCPAPKRLKDLARLEDGPPPRWPTSKMTKLEDGPARWWPSFKMDQLQDGPNLRWSSSKMDHLQDGPPPRSCPAPRWPSSKILPRRHPIPIPGVRAAHKLVAANIWLFQAKFKSKEFKKSTKTKSTQINSSQQNSTWVNRNQFQVLKQALAHKLVTPLHYLAFKDAPSSFSFGLKSTKEPTLT